MSIVYPYGMSEGYGCYLVLTTSHFLVLLHAFDVIRCLLSVKLMSLII